MPSEHSTYDLTELEQLAAFRPDSVKDIHNLADAYADLGRWHDAARAYRTALGLDPADADLYNSLATVHEELGNLDEAETAYQQAIELRPDDPLLYHNLGQLYEEQGRRSDAFRTYEQCLQVATDPDEHAAIRERLMQLQPESDFESFDVWRVGWFKKKWKLRLGRFEARFSSLDDAEAISVSRDRAHKLIPFITAENQKDARIFVLPLWGYNVAVRSGRKTHLFKLEPQALERLRTWLPEKAIGAPPAPMAAWRLVLAVTYGLVAALALGYAWYLVTNATGEMYGYAALLLGLVVGVVVSFMSGGNPDPRYSILGALLSALGIGFGEFLIRGLPDSKYRFEFGFTDLLFFALAIYEGWIVPRRPLAFVRRRHNLISERNRKPVLVAGILTLVLVLGLGARAGLHPSSEAAQAKKHLDRADEFLEAGKIEEAKAECEQAIELKPDYAEAHLMLGLIDLGQGYLIPSITSFSQAIDLGMESQDLATVYAFRGIARSGLSMYDVALADFDEAIARDSSNAWGFFGRGWVNAELGETEKAIADLERALELGLDASVKPETETLLEELKQSTTSKGATELEGTVSTTPTPVPTPGLDPAAMHIAPDGSGDYPDLRTAVEAADPGATIVLEPGTYELAEPLEVDKALHLVGAGMDETEIVSEAEGHVVRFSGDGLFAVRDITFRHLGNAVADAVVVQGGDVNFQRCGFSGSVTLVEEDEWHAGLRLQGNTTGVVQDCKAANNNGDGIWLEDQARLALEGNTCADNWGDGVYIEGEAQPTLEGNLCTGNGRSGISVLGQAQPTLERNTCTGNMISGINYADEAGGVARKNDCSQNQEGFAVTDQAQPTLEENTCMNNRFAGIRYTNTAGGLARGNECSGNDVGIEVSWSARPTLEGNICTDNTVGIKVLEGEGIGLGDAAEPTLVGNICTGNAETGIKYLDGTGGLARENECSGNKGPGIFVAEGAQPTLEGNTCTGNETSGIQYAITWEGATGGVARQNECSENGFAGIEVGSDSQPTLEDNICAGNGMVGIGFYDNSGGIAKHNTCSANGLAGIFVANQAKPSLEGNICADNKRTGIVFANEAAGVARENECYGNPVGLEIAETANPELIDNDFHDNTEDDVRDDRP